MSEFDDFNAKVIEEFRANGGKVGGPFEGAPMILVHHFGAKSGTERVAPMVWFPDGDRLLIVASKAGAPTNPDWYHNLKANPEVPVEVGMPGSYESPGQWVIDLAGPLIAAVPALPPAKIPSGCDA